MVAARSSLPLAASIYTARGPRGRAGGRQHSPAQMLPPPIPPGGPQPGDGGGSTGRAGGKEVALPMGSPSRAKRGPQRWGQALSVLGIFEKVPPIPKLIKSRGWWGWGRRCRRPRTVLGEGAQRGCRIRPLPGTAGTERGAALPVGVPPKSPAKRWCPPSPNHSAPWGTPILAPPSWGTSGPRLGTEIPSPASPQLRHGIKTSPGAPLGLASSCHIPAASRGQRPQGRIHPIPESPQT